MKNKYLRAILILSKVRITIMVAVTTFTGYVLAHQRVDPGLILPVAGIFLMACGSSVINQLQEIRTDAIMERTRNRPLPTAAVTSNFALILALLEILSGTAILYFSSGLVAALLGLIALAWYNGIYTPMKRLSAHAVIPGSVIGAIPPLVGWVAGGGSLGDINAWVMVIFFFIWQVPHFYLLALKYGKQYEQAGFPTILTKYTNKKAILLIYAWICATCISAITLWIAGLINSHAGIIVLLLAILWLNIAFIKPLLARKIEFKPISYFHRINLFVLLVILILSTDQFFQ
jgi:heme o synthase